MLYVFCKVGKLNSSLSPLSLSVAMSFLMAVKVVSLKQFLLQRGHNMPIASGQWAPTLSDVLVNR